MEYPQPSSSGKTNVDDRFKNILSEFKNAAKKYNPSAISKYSYDTTKLTNISNLTADALSAINVENAYADVQSQMTRSLDNEQAGAQNANNNVLKRDKSSSGLLPMIFGIVPKIINIAKKGKTIAAGLKEIPIGLGKLLTNLAVMTAILGIDSFLFVSHLGYYVFKLLICAVGKLMDAPKCFTFYFIDVIVFSMVVVLMSTLFIIDMIFMVKYWVGISLIEILMLVFKICDAIDKKVYEYVSIHIFHYPDPIINLCYKCRTMGDTRGFWAAARSMFNDIFVMFPTNVGEPAGEVITGFGHLFSFFF